ncbi:uncharacterized protein B0H18DRAFT_997932 [Fomitopsis serialis]|uniref:uncharacterized protein n=1 Tax=Fomitopsis serialis TaxID=139415 RepID=UPI002008DBEC|nr:uncharacterized protein B0H18DRAFT_997932 [Neoantrodia serialis]KAH9929178.1 hypothetical protein B0H18DRAFT_997932 [Neoantrodia serialis]
MMTVADCRHFVCRVAVGALRRRYGASSSPPQAGHLAPEAGPFHAQTTYQGCLRPIGAIEGLDPNFRDVSLGRSLHPRQERRSPSCASQQR